MGFCASFPSERPKPSNEEGSTRPAFVNETNDALLKLRRKFWVTRIGRTKKTRSGTGKLNFFR